MQCCIYIWKYILLNASFCLTLIQRGWYFFLYLYKQNMQLLQGMCRFSIFMSIFCVLLLYLYIYTCPSHNCSVGVKINSASSFFQCSRLLWICSISSGHSYGNGEPFVKQNSRKTNTITVSCHFPHSADQSWQCCVWSM